MLQKEITWFRNLVEEGATESQTLATKCINIAFPLFEKGAAVYEAVETNPIFSAVESLIPAAYQKPVGIILTNVQKMVNVADNAQVMQALQTHTIASITAVIEEDETNVLYWLGKVAKFLGDQ
jgi:hypothetical protein